MKATTLLCTFLLLFGCSPNEKEKQKEESQETTLDLSAYNLVSPNTIIVYDKLNFGNGYNSATGTEYFGVMNFDGAIKSAEIMANARGNSGIVTMQILETKESLKKALGITAKVDLDFKIFGVTSENSLKAKMYRETEFNDFQQNAVLKAQYSNEPLVMIGPSVKEDLIELATRDPETFMRTCGDMFVSRIYTGGEMHALFSLHSRNSNEKKQNELFFESVNTYLGNKLSASVDVKQLEEKQKNTKNINTTVITEGGGKTPTTAKLEDFITYANEFKEQVSADNRAVILYVELSPYESIAGFPKINFNEIRVKQRSYLDLATSMYDDLEASIDNAEFVQKYPEVFEEHDLKLADSVRSFFPIKQAELASLILRCQTDFSLCDQENLEPFSLVELFGPDVELPEWPGEQKPLPVDPDGFVQVTDNTMDGRILSIDGDLEIKRNTKTKAFCNSPKYERQVQMYGREKVKEAGWFTDAEYQNIYAVYEYPYYWVRYRDVSTNKIIKEFAWSGNPQETEKNVVIEIELRPGVHYLVDAARRPIGTKREKKLKFDRTPRYPIVRACQGGEPPIAVVSPLDAEPIPHRVEKRGPLTATIPEADIKTPDVILKDGEYFYDFD
ncbi:hypothetical protein ACFQ1M_07360 [Sungkyunkwania multivorans]|uniref:Uncharacterized protein n=1 Tax=Sungkyunkwania multivorans TaxID=1173618 RepID=A0ABW3CY21_9FLAO